LLLTTDLLDPFLRGMPLLLWPELTERAPRETRRGQRTFVAGCPTFCALVHRTDHRVPAHRFRAEMD
jgi:hypothetical protein